MKNKKVCGKTRSPPASRLFKGQGTEHTTVKWPIGNRRQKLFSSPKWLLMQTKTMFFCQLKEVGVLHIKSVVHSNPYFRFFQGSKCMLALLWVLHLFSFWFHLLFPLLSLSGSWCLRCRHKKSVLLLSVKVAVLVREKVLAHTRLTNAWPVFLWTSPPPPF